MLETKVRVVGEMTYKLKDKGVIVEQDTIKNLIVDVGENMLAYLIKGDDSTKGYVTHMAIGTGTDTATESDTSLQTQINRRPAPGVVTGSYIDFTATWPSAEGPYSITESGLFTASSTGNMFNRATFTTIAKPTGQELELTWRLTFE